MDTSTHAAPRHFSLAAATIGFLSSTFGLITLMVMLAAA